MDEEFKKFITFFIIIFTLYSFWENLKKDILAERGIKSERVISSNFNLYRGVPVNVIKR
jgi:hypothetical protein